MLFLIASHYDWRVNLLFWFSHILCNSLKCVRVFPGNCHRANAWHMPIRHELTAVTESSEVVRSSSLLELEEKLQSLADTPSPKDPGL